MTNEELSKTICDDVAKRLGINIGPAYREICYQVAMTMAQQKDKTWKQSLSKIMKTSEENYNSLYDLLSNAVEH